MAYTKSVNDLGVTLEMVEIQVPNQRISGGQGLGDVQGGHDVDLPLHSRDEVGWLGHLGSCP